MFNIFNNLNQIVDTASSFLSAASTVTFLDKSDKASAPHFCSPA